MPSNQTYLGDGVYASFDGFMIRLSTERAVEHFIYLEPEVYKSLVDFADRCFNAPPNR